MPDGGARAILVPVALQARERLLIKYLADQAQSLVERQPRAVARGDAGRLLAAVLQGVQADKIEAGDVRSRSLDSDHAALFPRAVWFVRRLLGHGPIIRAPAGAGSHRPARVPEVPGGYCTAPPTAHFGLLPWLRAGNA